MFWKKKQAKIKAVEITEENFNDMVTSTNQPILIDFWAAWCGPCKVIGPIIDELAADYAGKALIAKVNVQQNEKLSAHFKIKSIPTLVIINRGAVREVFKGLIPKPNLEEILEEYIAENIALDNTPKDEEE